jgi:hypothetical protein
MQIRVKPRKREDEVEDAPETRQEHDAEGVLDEAGCCLADLDEALAPVLSEAEEREQALREYSNLETFGDLQVWRAKYAHLHLRSCCGDPL